MARRRAGWSYCVDAPSFLACYRSKATALRVAKARAKRSGGKQVFVEKVKTNRAGVHNQYAKGARVIWSNR
jgi:hypothetical protein